MAIRCECFCGAHYTLPDEYAGKRAKCSRCGHLIVIPSGRPEELEPLQLAEEDSQPSPEARMTFAEHERQARQAFLRQAPKGMSAPPAVIIETGSGFWRDAGRAFCLFSSLEASLVFLFLWFVNVSVIFISLAPCVGFLLGLLVYGYVCSYYLRTVTHAAAGDEGLPPIGVGGNWIDDMLIPMLQWLGCQLFVLAPAIIAAILMFIYAVPKNISIATCGVLGAMGMFFWPIFILTVALGGFSMLFRFDKCVTAVFRSPGPYVLICVLLTVAIAPIWAAKIYIYFQGAGLLAELVGVSTFTLRIILLGLETYCMLVCTRLIGLYYHHFKDDFPWALG